jgi:hypothetical protein
MENRVGQDLRDGERIRILVHHLAVSLELHWRRTRSIPRETLRLCIYAGEYAEDLSSA